jgi:hypothetical protein
MGRLSQIWRESRGLIIQEILATLNIIFGLGIVILGWMLLQVAPENPIVSNGSAVFIALGITLIFFGLGLVYTYHRDYKNDQDTLEIKEKLERIENLIKNQESNSETNCPIKHEGDSTELKNPDSVRVILQIAYERNKELASYIRLTDAAIWGFLGIVFIELFKDNLQLLPYKIIIFSLLIAISMWLWRETISRYQKDIVEGYVTIIRCEHILCISDDIALKTKFISKNFPELVTETDKERQFQKLLEKFQNHEYYDPNHKKLDDFAHVVMLISIIVLVVSLFFLIFPINHYVNHKIR